MVGSIGVLQPIPLPDDTPFVVTRSTGWYNGRGIGMDMSNIARKQSKKRTRERTSDQEAKEIKAEAREIMPQPSTMTTSIVLSIEDKLNYLEQPIPPAPVAPEGQLVAPEITTAHTA
ncbi:hypothetical protein Tco_0750553 [Tanacetum coccineum]|uniref:Uncharacterized protein n=1 Tax=Tanacetum coccineum TaxID=301880 RepID=A0ABQ4Z4R1_9ASTR